MPLNRAIETQVATRYASGSTQMEIAKELGIAQTTVSAITRRPNSKAILQRATEAIVASAAELVRDSIDESLLAGKITKYLRGQIQDNPLPNVTNSIVTKDGDVITVPDTNAIVALKKEANAVRARLLRTVGLSDSQSPAYLLQQIIQVGSGAGLDIVVAQAIGQSMSNLLQPPPSDPDLSDVIDI